MPAHMNTESRRKASATYHAKREAEGLKKVTLWLSPEARFKLDALKAAAGSKDKAAELAILAWKGPGDPERAPKPAKPTKAKPDIAANHADIAARFPKTLAKLAESEQAPKAAKAKPAPKPAGRIRGFTDDGEPIMEPTFVSRQKAGKK